MLIYDITSAKSALNTVLLLTGVSPNEILSFISSNIISDGCFRDGTALTGENFMNEFALSNEISDISKICVCGVHYTSNDDNNRALQNYGLRDLQFSLSANTPLKRFLVEHSIHFDVVKQSMTIGTKEYDISYTRGRFDLDNPISSIARKVYYDNALSCFLYIEDIERYLGEVHIRPEILYDIDRMYSELQLSYKWKQRCAAYEIKFASPITLFEDYSFRDDDKDLYEALLDKALLVAGDMSCGEVFAYMKPLSVISKDQILSIKKLG